MSIDLPVWLPLFQWGVVTGASLAAAVSDVRRRRIPNMLTVPLLAAGLIVAAIVAGPTGLGRSALAMAVVGMPFVLLFAFGGGGAGDAKLMAGIGAWLGLADGLIVLAAVLLWGGVMAVGYAAIRRRLPEVAFNLTSTAKMLAAGRVARDEQAGLPGMPMRFPYALAIAAGVMSGMIGVQLWPMLT